MHYIVEKKANMLGATFKIGDTGVAVVSRQIFSANLERIFVSSEDGNDSRGAGMGTILLDCAASVAAKWTNSLTGKLDPFPGEYEKTVKWYKKRGFLVHGTDSLSGQIDNIREKCAELIDLYDLTCEVIVTN